MQHDRPKAPGDGSGGGGRVQYRLYILEGVQSLISYSHAFEAAGDNEAFEIAEARRQGRPAELWQGARKLKSWEGGQ